MSHLTERKTDWDRHPRLLTLPPELRNKFERNQIYEHCLFVGEVQLVNSKKEKYPPPPLMPPTVLTFLQTCRQIRDEAEGIFYAVNKLSIVENDLFLYLCPLGNTPKPTRRQFIRERTVEVGPPMVITPLLDHASRIPNLRVLRLHVVSTVSRKGYTDRYFNNGNVASIDENSAQWWINRLPKLKEFSVSTPHSEYWGRRLREVETLIQALIEERDKAIASQVVEGIGRLQINNEYQTA